MELNRFAKGALVFTAASAVLTLIDVSIMFRNTAWMKFTPQWWRDVMPPLVNVVFPVLFVVTAFAVLWLLSGRRPAQRTGYYLLLLVAATNLVIGCLTAYWRIDAALFQASVVCAVQVITNAAVIYYCLGGLREAMAAAAGAGASQAHDVTGARA